MKKHVDIIVPIHNEEKNIPSMVEAIQNVFSVLPYSFTLLFVDDGSKDGSLAMLKQVALQFLSCWGSLPMSPAGGRDPGIHGERHPTGTKLFNQYKNMQAHNRGKSKVSYIIQATLCCIVFTALFVVFSFAKFFPDNTERISHGILGTFAAFFTPYYF